MDMGTREVECCATSKGCSSHTGPQLIKALHASRKMTVAQPLPSVSPAQYLIARLERASVLEMTIALPWSQVLPVELLILRLRIPQTHGSTANTTTCWAVMLEGPGELAEHETSNMTTGSC